jgi:hypothetical protein
MLRAEDTICTEKRKRKDEENLFAHTRYWEMGIKVRFEQSV